MGVKISEGIENISETTLKLCNELLDKALERQRLAYQPERNMRDKKDFFSKAQLEFIKEETDKGESIRKIADKLPQARSTVAKVVLEYKKVKANKRAIKLSLGKQS